MSGPIQSIEPLPGGHINDSYRVTCADQNGTSTSYLLQHLNPDVFPHAGEVMENIANVTRHLAAKRRAGRTSHEVLTLVPSTAGAAWTEDASHSCWRMFGFIGGTHVRERAESPDEVREAARAFGEFLRLLADYSGPPLNETMPGFHDTRARVERFIEALKRDAARRSRDAKVEIDAVTAHAHLANMLPPYLSTGELPRRIVHNDAKLANVLLDDATGTARCVVDLDTVMPGCLLHDFGDMVRSMTSPTDEDTEDLSEVGVRLPMFEALAAGFLESAGAMLEPLERALLVHAGQIITFEQAVRFLTDHLEGDRYYRAVRPGQNLQRCRTQLQLLESLIVRKAEMQAIVARLLGEPV